MKKYKFINIKQVDNEQFNGKPHYKIFNNKTTAFLGHISYYKLWKEYVFSSSEGCAFNNTCLRDVIDFMEKHIK